MILARCSSSFLKLVLLLESVGAAQFYCASTVPKHNEINRYLVIKICRDLGISDPRKKRKSDLLPEKKKRRTLRSRTLGADWILRRAIGGGLPLEFTEFTFTEGYPWSLPWSLNSSLHRESFQSSF